MNGKEIMENLKELFEDDANRLRDSGFINPFQFAGYQVKISDRLPNTKTETYVRRLTMVEQWKRWGLNLWRYEEEEEATRTVPAKDEQVYIFGNTMVVSPITHAQLFNTDAV